MAQVRRIPFTGAATLGRGVNVLTGAMVGKALDVETMEEVLPGQDALYRVQMVTTRESLMESLGLSVEASGRYGLFSAGGKFKLSEQSSFNSQSSFVVASCRVQNAFMMVDRVKLRPEANIAREDPEKFKNAFGTMFVRGLETGGEFFAILQATSTDTAAQSDLAAAFQADCQGLIVGGSFKSKLEKTMASTQHRTEISITVYQRAGQDEELSITQDAQAVIERLKRFPKIARVNPCGYEVEIADYATLALPPLNEELLFDRELSLTDCARLRMKYMTLRNDIEFARLNQGYFVDLPSDEELAAAGAAYTRAVTLVQIHAQRIAARAIPPTVFDLKAADPDLDLPVIVLQRLGVVEETLVPNLVAMPIGAAKEFLAGIGLKADTRSFAVKKEAKQPLDSVTAQTPAAGTKVKAGTTVTLSYNYISDTRFRWVVGTLAQQNAKIKVNQSAVENLTGTKVVGKKLGKRK